MDVHQLTHDVRVKTFRDSMLRIYRSIDEPSARKTVCHDLLSGETSVVLIDLIAALTEYGVQKEPRQTADPIVNPAWNLD